MEINRVSGLVINAPQFFLDPEFMTWLNGRESVMTWHKKGAEPNDFSDVVVFVDPSLEGEGTDSDMPEAIWNSIVQACRDQSLGGQNFHIPVRLTNLHA